MADDKTTDEVADAAKAAAEIAACEKDIALVAHLSSEIDSQVKAMVAWRSRLSFTAYFGPWIALGGYFAVTGAHFQWPKDLSALIWWGAALLVGYIAVGFTCGWIEAHVWRQCNSWRESISRIHKGEDPLDITFKQRVKQGYFVAYVIMVVVLVSSVGVLVQVTDEKPAAESPSTARDANASTEAN